MVARAGLVPRIICRDPGEQEALRRLAGAGVAVHVQEGRGLGDALEFAFRRGLAGGAPVVGVLGADIPTLPPAVLTEACRAVQDGHHVALGRSEDGGYYLLAAGAVYPSLFREMIWSTEGVADETLRRCAAAGLRPFLLPTWADVDDGPALAALRDELRRAPPGVAPHTRGVLEASGGSTGSHPPGNTAPIARAYARDMTHPHPHPHPQHLPGRSRFGHCMGVAGGSAARGRGSPPIPAPSRR